MVETVQSTGGIGRASAEPNLLRRALRSSVHFLSYHFILKSGRTTVSRAAGFRLIVRPTVFHPRYFITSELLAGFIAKLDLAGKRVADIGTGSGILALAAARAGADSVIAIDINPNAAHSAGENAGVNGLQERVRPVCSNLFNALAPRPLFDVIVSNPPYFPGEPRDLSDRAWYGGEDYCDIVTLFDQARQRLTSGGRIYVVLSSLCDLDYLETLFARAKLKSRIVKKRWIVIESLIIYELRPE